MARSGPFITVCMVLVFCAATGIPSPAQTLHNFAGRDGQGPDGRFIQARDGNFYGTTAKGGINNGNCNDPRGCGTVFKMTASGGLTTLYSFCSQSQCFDGWSPTSGLVQASDGNFYGTTINGGTRGVGTVFKITPAGTLTTLYSFLGPGTQ